ncbi:hypothetical protein PAMP_011502 [Pampus punctatissimus]
MAKRDPIKETELKIALVTLWGVKTFKHSCCPVIPECSAWTCLAFYDIKTDLVTATMDKALYRHISRLTTASNRHVYTSTGVNGSSLAHLANLMLMHPAAVSWGGAQAAGLGTTQDRMLLQMAESVVKHLEQANGKGRDSDSSKPVTELGSDVKLVWSYPSSVSVAHLEETLSIWTLMS